MWSDLTKLWQLSGFFRGTVVALCLLSTGLVGFCCFELLGGSAGANQSGSNSQVQATTNTQTSGGTQAQGGGNAPAQGGGSRQAPPGGQGASRGGGSQPTARTGPSVAPTSNNTATLPSVAAPSYFPSPGVWYLVDPAKKPPIIMSLTLEANGEYSDGNEEPSINKFYETDGSGMIRFKRRNVATGTVDDFIIGRYSRTDDPAVWKFKQLKPATSKDLELHSRR